MTKFDELIDRRHDNYGEKFDPAHLAKQFIEFYNSGDRIKVNTCGMTLTGTIGVTTGWRPSFLLMRTKRSIGSPWVLDEGDKILAVQNSRGQYVYFN